MASPLCDNSRFPPPPGIGLSAMWLQRLNQALSEIGVPALSGGQ